jgi:hypothetical protein
MSGSIFLISGSFSIEPLVEIPKLKFGQLKKEINFQKSFLNIDIIFLVYTIPSLG